jgi:hypothetical protein
VHRIWPGTQRLLLWGDPLFAAAYARQFTFCGSAGVEIFEPLSFKGRKGSGLAGGRDGYADLTLRAAGDDFEKYRYTYRLLGRMLYNPNTAPDVWQRQLRHDYGAAVAPFAEAALANAGRILPLLTTAHLPSAANNNFWPEMPVNMSIVSDAKPQPYTDTPAPKRFGFVSPLDPQLFSRIDDFAGELMADKTSAKYSPIEVATWLDNFAQAAADQLALAKTKTTDRTAPAFRRFAIDVEVQIALGRFWAQKLRAGVLYALHEKTANRAAFDAALAHYRAARATWAQLVALTTGVYVRDVSYGEGWFQRGHWADRLAAIDTDIAAMEKSMRSGLGATLPSTPEKNATLIARVLGRATTALAQAAHTPPKEFRRGEAVELEITLEASVTAVQLHYRHVNQAESWRSAPVEISAVRGQAAIPADYTDTPYPLEYYFEISSANGGCTLFPGLGASLTQQPYFVLR